MIEDSSASVVDHEEIVEDGRPQDDLSDDVTSEAKFEYSIKIINE